MGRARRLTAIDLYAGVGGWGLGLKLAGIDVVASYEWWKPAAFTHEANLGGATIVADIRTLGEGAFPRSVDIVVGSPPCTEFSYANRGGGGDIDEGLKDVAKFLWVVDKLKPRFWAMENVPRVAAVLERELANSKGPLYRYRHLEMQVRVLDLSDYGVPQARRRCIAGNFPWELLEKYRAKLPSRTLGDVMNALASPAVVRDPNFGLELPATSLTEMDREAAFNDEELRMNREAKEFHPVYNNMSFPDRLDAPARTVTATCTRVSRESIVVHDRKHSRGYRRLTIRERACLQGFPITYQFYGSSFSDKAKMVGNAIPPLFTYLLASAMKGVPPVRLPSFDAIGDKLSLPSLPAPVTVPDSEGRSYPASRRFRSAIPGLRFKSGVRFELVNSFETGSPSWSVQFYFGNSKSIQSIGLRAELLKALTKQRVLKKALGAAAPSLEAVIALLDRSSPDALQASWTHRQAGVRTYDLVDAVGVAAATIEAVLKDSSTPDELESVIVGVAMDGNSDASGTGVTKLCRHASAVVAGLLVGSWFNSLEWHSPRKAAA